MAWWELDEFLIALCFQRTSYYLRSSKRNSYQ